MKKLISAAVLALTLAACVNPVYRPVLNQGSAVTPTLLTKLKVGQTTEQVLYIIGSPNIVDNNGNKWLYVHRMVDNHGKTSQETYVLNFSKGKLVSYQKNENAKAK